MNLSDKDIEAIIKDTRHMNKQEIEESYHRGSLNVYLNESLAKKDFDGKYEYSQLEKTLLPSGKVVIYYN